ncbi:MAG: STAS domain-containing protein [Anaerolineae bacterium]|nr:STAS domain-containing protein [Anaerolineae bacterium]
MSTISVKRLNDVVVVKVHERMDILNAPSLVDEFNHLLDDGITNLIVDLSGVHTVDADGDYPLLHLLRRVQEVDGCLHLVCPPENPIRVFYELMHLDVLFSIYETLEAALLDFEIYPDHQPHFSNGHISLS